MLPRPVLDEVAGTLGVSPDRLEVGSRVTGGCINNGARLDTPDGPRFVKWRADAPPDAFSTEAEGLAALAEGEVRVPRVDGVGSQWLLLEWVDEGRAGPDGWASLGEGLAGLHGVTPPVECGWTQDNYVGSLPQPNPPSASWPEFWVSVRLAPLLERGAAMGLLGPSERDALGAAFERIPDLVGDASRTDGPSLLHGDLWSGNVIFDPSGGPVLIDPAVYVGHREVDLAMTGLFGGFPRTFYEAYASRWPLQPGFDDRLPAYRLYPLLVHVLLFGRSYVPSLVEAAEAVAKT